MHERLASSTFMIICGKNIGSGFLFKKNDIVITNHHVIKDNIDKKEPIYVLPETTVKQRRGFEAKLVVHDVDLDYAVLVLTDPQLPRFPGLPGMPTPLVTSKDTKTYRGRKVLFAGFPHGIDDLLVHEAIVSGPLGHHAFYIDGMVNGGNSGGPIVDAITGDLIGIVTQRRFFLEADARLLAQNAEQIARNLMPAATSNVQIMGINFDSFFKNISGVISMIPNLVALNANSGIGIGFNIQFVDQEVR